jgi:outer membrane protein assembly factor BamD (BamD/ComL family)
MRVQRRLSLSWVLQMKRLWCIAGLLVLGTLSFALSSVAALADRRVAFVVGNSSYQATGRLTNPARDADAVADMLKKSGYEVTLVRDVGYLDFKRAIRAFEDSASDADVAVIFYAGHGIEIAGTNYLIPVDAKLASDRDAVDEAVDLNRLVATVEGAKRLRVIILDACRDNPFLNTMKRRQAQRQIASGLGPVGVSSETFVAYAAARGATAEDGGGDHSPFTTAILHHLSQPGLDVRIAFGLVRDEVRKITNNRQEPYFYGSLGGGVIPIVPLPEKPSPPIVDEDKMRTDYEDARRLVDRYGSKKPLQDFVERYPSGYLSKLANEELKQIELAAIPNQQPPFPAQPSPDAQAWEEIKDTSDVDALRRFIQRFRDSPKALEAQHRLEILVRNQRDREDQARREKAEAELAKAWEAVQGTDDQAKLRDFIRRYPSTQYTDAAKQRLDTVIRAAQEREEAARAAAVEERRVKTEAEMKRAFDAAAAAPDQSVVRDFIRRYPDSPYLTRAKSHLDTLIAAEQERKEQERLAANEARRQKMEADAVAAWNSVKNSSNPTDVQNFIKRFPESTLALKDASERLGELDREAGDRVARAQAEAAEARAVWDRIKDTSNIPTVQNFIKQYPNTPTAMQAKRWLEVLELRVKEREAKALKEAEAAQAWNRIQNTTDLAEVRSFIKRYPDSAVALTDAARRQAAIEREAADRAEKARAEAAAARTAWDLVKGSNDPVELRDFIYRYPNSSFATRDAKLRIDLLERQAREREDKARREATEREAKEQAEAELEQAWDQTKESQDPADYRSFIKRYPDSRFTPMAKQRLADLGLPETNERPGSERRRESVPPRPIVTAPPHYVPAALPPYREAPAPPYREAPAPPHREAPAPPHREAPALPHREAPALPHREAPAPRHEAPPRREIAIAPRSRSTVGLSRPAGGGGGSSGGGSGFLSLER